MRVAAILLALVPAALAGQTRRITITPERPRPGAFVRLTLAALPGDTAATIAGTMAGEPLHFSHFTRTGWVALAGVPVDASDSVVAHVTVSAGGRTETLRARALVPKVRVVRSKLDVATTFTQPMDSATTARIARENASARAAGKRAHETPRLWREPFEVPRDAVVTSEFGSGRLFNGVMSSRHLGVDFRGAVGDPVRAANRGVVALVDTFFLAGRVVYIDHGAGVVTGYFHLSQALVSVGDTVQRGQLIGRVGQSGRVTGPHLHWAARYGALSVNPMDLVTLTTPSTSGHLPRRTPSSSAPAPR